MSDSSDSDGGGPEPGPADLEDKVEEFKAVCGVDDSQLARRCLEQCSFSLEVAVQEFLNQKEGHPSIFSQEGQENEANRQQELRHRRMGAAARNLVPRRSGNGPLRSGYWATGAGGAALQRRMGWGEWAWTLLVLPFRFTFSVFADILRFMYGFFMRPRLMAVTDPEGDVRSFLDEYEAAFGTAHPKFMRTSYSAALEAAKTELKFLLVYLHSPEHEQTARFCREVLADPALLAFLDQNALLFWACSVKKPEGYRVSQALRESAYPFLALICMRNNRMSMVVRQEGPVSPGNLLALLATAIQDNEPYLRMAREERQHRNLTQLLRQEQEEAFQESLREDREREERRLAEERRLREEEKEAERVQRSNEQREKDLEARKEEIRESLPEEPEATEPDCVRVSLKFPSGARISRNFRLTDSLEVLYNVALVHADAPRSFSLVTNFPRKALACRPAWLDAFAPAPAPESGGAGSHSKSPSAAAPGAPIPSFREAGISASLAIFVQDDEA